MTLLAVRSSARPAAEASTSIIHTSAIKPDQTGHNQKSWEEEEEEEVLISDALKLGGRVAGRRASKSRVPTKLDSIDPNAPKIRAI
jgi:hypothetical protein